MLLLALLLLTQAPDTVRYAIVSNGQPAGMAKVWGSSGDVWVDMQFNDRGRGPHLVEHDLVAADGLPTAVEITGHNYLKDTVSERFSTDGKEMRWTNSIEGIQTLPARRGFYTAADGANPTLLLRALLASPTHTLPLLPAGEATLEKAGTLTIHAGSQTRTVVQYAIGGLGFTPAPVWADSDGHFFAQASLFASTIREGWEAAVPALVQAQDAAAATRLEAWARTLAHHPTGALVIRNATMFDAVTATTKPHTTVVVQGDRIASVGEDGRVTIPAGAQVIDGAGRTLLPGLWDMHVHMSPTEDGMMHIAAGVTTVRDMGNDTTLLALRQRFDQGTVIGPRVILAGIVDGRGPFQVPIGLLADTDDEARRVVDTYARLGYEQIKVYSSMKPEVVPAIIDQAHKHHLRVSGHVPAYMTAEQVVRLGFDEVQHVNFLMLNFMDTVKDTRSMARFTAVAAHGAEIDLHSQRVQNFIRLLHERGTVIDPTVAGFEDMFTGRPRVLSSSFSMVADRFPAQVRRGLYGGGLPVTPALDQRYRDSYAAMVRMVGEMYRGGVRIVAGTDGFVGFLLHRELELYVQAGIPAPKVLQLATLGSAQVMKHDDERGSIAPGKLADLILVRGDPTVHISDIRNVETVVKGGVVYRSDEVYGALGVKPAVTP